MLEAMPDQTHGGKRVLGRLRLSQHTEESTSIERQKDVINQWSDTNGCTVIGWAEDVDVSRSVDPFETPALGAWFKPDKADKWDIVACWKLDRLATGSIYLNKVMDWCAKHDKALVSVTENFDLSTWVGRLIANVIAGVAEGELEAIRERSIMSRAKLLQIGRWPGGAIPYWCEKYNTNPGYKLRTIPDRAEIVNQAIKAVIAGKSVDEVAHDLNAAGKPTARGAKWSSKVLWQILTNKTLLGYATYEGDTIRDAEGKPVLFAEPLISLDRWDELQHALEQRRNPNRKRTRTPSRVLGVAKCMTCGQNYQFREHDKGGKHYRYYWCRGRHPGEGQIPAGDLEELLETEFLDHVGSLEVLERVYVPAKSHEDELNAARVALEEFMPMLATLSSKTARERVTEQISALDARIAELEQLPVREAKYELRGTGKTFAEEWASSEWPDRRELLLKSGITLTARLTGRGRRPGESGVFEAKLNIPPDIRQRMQDEGRNEN